MKIRSLFNIFLGISSEVLYSLIIMLTAFVICLAITF
jgi:hypothetical protein